MRTFSPSAALLSAALLAPLAAHAQDAAGTAMGTVIDAERAEVGTITLSETPSGLTHIVIEVTGVPEGVHGVHIHETGDCSADDFSSAGGHLAGDMEHGFLAEGGPHPGDLPNAHVQSDGVLMVEHVTDRLTLGDMLFDADGSAFIVHSGADDYESQPSGEAGSRLNCAVIERAGS